MEQNTSQTTSIDVPLDKSAQVTELSNSPSGNIKNLLIVALSILLIAATSFAYYFYTKSSQVTQVISQPLGSTAPIIQDATSLPATSQPTQSTKTESFTLSYYDYETKKTSPALKLTAQLPARAVVSVNSDNQQKYDMETKDFSMSFDLPTDGGTSSSLKDPTVATISNSYALNPIIRIHSEDTLEPIFYYGSITESGPATQVCNGYFENAKPEDMCYKYFAGIQL